VPGPHRRSVECEEAAAFEDAVDDGLGEVFVVEDLPPGGGGLVGGEDDRALAAMPIVDDVEEHVRRVGAVGQIADLVHDEECGVRVGRERLGETSFPKCCREIVDELGGGREEGIESVLDGAVGEGDGEVRLRPGLPRRIRQRPSVTKSADRAEPRSDRRTVDWKVKSKSSMVLRKGKLAHRESRPRRVCWRCAISSATKSARKSR